MEDFIFDDDVDEVGAEVEAHCPKCKADTAHVVISKYEDEIRRVQCNPCGDIHPFRKPRGDGFEEEIAEPATKKKPPKAKPTWDQVMAKAKKPPRPYGISDHFKELEVISHPKFGVGYVTELIGDDKIEVTFQNDKRVLVHNRKGLQLPFSMLRPLTPPMPKGAKSKKPIGKKAAGSPPKPLGPKANGAARPVKPAARSAKPAAKPKLPTRQVKQKTRPQAARARSKPASKAAPHKQAGRKR